MADPYGGMRTKGAQPGSTSRMRRTHKNKKADRWGRAGAARDAVALSVPPSIRWALSHPKQARPHFTEFQWAILLARYSVLDFTPVRNSSKVVGEILGMTGRSKIVRDQEGAAERTALEMFVEWRPAMRVWHLWKQGHGRRPDKAEFAILAKYRRRERQPKKGRHAVEPFGVTVDSDDVLSVRRYNAVTGEWYGIADEELKGETMPGGEYDASEEDPRRAADDE
jgi:hypothetical protein